MKRIIIDTNLWISFLLNVNFDQLDTLIFEQKCQLIFSKELLNEFVIVCRRPKLRSYFRVENLSNLLEINNEHAEFIEVESVVELCRDPKDNFLLSLGKDGKADYLITGDKDLLVLEKVDNMQICTILELLERLDAK
jgi:putative PIN family toxin of toxin-antitoxin system